LSLTYFAKVTAVMQRLATAMAVLPDETCTLTWSMLATSAAVIFVPVGVVL
jgi:hypothetical protein